MSVQTRSLRPRQDDAVANKWARRRDIPIAILAWVAVVYVVLLGASHIIRTILLLVIASLLAYALAPGVKILRRFMPRFLAILIMYLVVLGAVSLLLYFITRTSIEQIASLSHNVQKILTPSRAGQISPIDQTLQSVGISQDQVGSIRTQITSRLESAAGGALPFVTGLFDTVLDIILVAVLSIYLLIDGSRVTNWFRQNAPQTTRADFVLDTLQRVVGGYIRGQFLLAALIGVLVGVGMALLHVPYAVLLGVLAFFFAFVPVLGTFLSGAICTLLALTQGWLIAVAVLIYFIVVHVIEGDVVGPRIVGKAVGLHPIVSLSALVAGSELFGIWGALFASPVAGVLQALVIALWTNWRTTHPEAFERTKQKVADKVDEGLSGGQNQEDSEQHTEMVESTSVPAVPEQKRD
jgi:predicted PurR-regulated permease PerM